MAERPSVFRAFDQLVGLQSPKLLVGGSNPSRPAISVSGGMEDTPALGAGARKGVWVRVPPCRLFFFNSVGVGTGRRYGLKIRCQKREGSRPYLPISLCVRPSSSVG